MKFSIPLALCYLTTGVYSYVAAEPPTRVLARDVPSIVERDLATATSVLADVKNGFNKVSDATNGFSGDIAPFKSAAEGLLSTVSSGTTAVNNMTPLSTTDCFSLIGPAGDLKKQGQALADTLKGKKADLQKAGDCATVYDVLDRGYQASAGLITAIVNKVPSGFKSTVQSQGDEVTNTLKDTRDQFAPANCS